MAALTALSSLAFILFAIAIFNEQFRTTLSKKLTRKKAVVAAVGFLFLAAVTKSGGEPDKVELSADPAPVVETASAEKSTEDADKAKADEEAKKKAENEAKAKAAAEAKAKAEAEAKKKAEQAALAAKAVIDLNKHARKTEKEVNTVLGAPAETESVNWGLLDEGIKIKGKMNYYKNGKVEIMFLEGKAHRIRVNLTKDEFNTGDKMKENLAYMGLPGIELESAENEIQKAFYANVEGYYSIQTGAWLGTDDGYVLAITESRYR
ncbi:hypothetical protein [Paenibacillus gansuensis]|uniref:DUF4309 domain-containing protein n=1 Tax=Paenibacillus gansuensis TaxID=306542 RepID=A0ABW5PCV9_9BACL